MRLADKNIKLKTVMDQWNHYVDRVGLLKDVSVQSVQYREMRKSFFAGAAEALLLTRDEVTKLNEENGVEYLKSLMLEIHTFFHQESLNFKKNKDK